jgi:hypothetical protein
MQSFVSVATCTTTFDKFKPTKAGIGSSLAAGINGDFIPGTKD